MDSPHRDDRDDADLASGGVAVFLTHDTPGGARVVVEVLCDGLRRRGMPVRLGFLYGEGRIEGAPPLVRGGLGRFALWSPFALIRLFRQFRRTRPRAVIANLPMANAIVLTVAALARVPQRLAVHHVDTESYRPGSRWIDLIAGTVGAYTRVIAVSEPVRRSLARHPERYRRRIKAIDNGMPRRSTSADRATLRRRFGIDPDEIVAINVGRLSEQKNQAVLIDAMQELEGVRLVLLGDGELRQDLEDRARRSGVTDHVVFAGLVDPQTVTDWLAAADLFVLPSLYEGLSLALIEALHARLPMLVSDVPSNTAPFESANGRLCLAAPAKDTAAWQALIRRAASDPLLRERYAEAAASLSGRYDAERMIEAYLAEIEGAVTPPTVHRRSAARPTPTH